MPASKCQSCSSTAFEIVAHKPENVGYNLNFIQCAGCGAVIGIHHSDAGVKADTEKWIRWLKNEMLSHLGKRS